MAIDRGKQWEKIIKDSWGTTFPESFIIRLYDSTNGYFATSSNPCDFIGYVYGQLYLIEAKSSGGNTWSIVNFRQYDKLMSYSGLNGVHPGVLIWFTEKQKVIWVPIEEIELMIKDGLKSVNVKMLDEKKYNIIDIPCKFTRVLPKPDFKILSEVYSVK